MRIILIGMKGCGKTTLGTLLAEKLQISFIDSDTEIEKTHGREKVKLFLSVRFLRNMEKRIFVFWRQEP